MSEALFQQNDSHDARFADTYEIAFIYLENMDQVGLEYYGIKENTQFDVYFDVRGDTFVLQRFGLKKDIPKEWIEKL